MLNANAPTVVVAATSRVNPLIGSRGPQADTGQKGVTLYELKVEPFSGGGPYQEPGGHFPRA